MANPLLSMQYFGGKSFNKPVGPWVARQLPAATMYVEPFMGMLGVLLNRPAADLEWANDADAAVTNWWQIVRDRGPELVEALRLTPPSQHEMDLARATFRDPEACEDPLERARRMTVAFALSMNAKPGTLIDSPGGATRMLTSIAGRIDALADRMRFVVLHNADAATLIDRVATLEGVPDAGKLIYCDPPYPGTTVSQYAPDFDAEGFAKTVADLPIRCAVSGVAESWPQLTEAGWRCETLVRHASLTQERNTRIEALWMNYLANQPTLFAV